MTALPEPPRTPKAAATRRLLLELAARLFIEQGYNAVSLRDIADEAGLTKGAIYGHFRSKGQLLVEVIRAQLDERDALLDVGGADDEAALSERFLGSDAGDLRVLQIDAAAAARHDPDVATGMAEINTSRRRRIMASLQETDDPETWAFVINALSLGIGVQEAHGLPIPDASEWRRVVERILVAARTPTGADA